MAEPKTARQAINLMVKNGVSLTWISNRIGCSVSHLSLLKRGKNNASEELTNSLLALASRYSEAA